MMAGRRLIAGKQALDVELDMRTGIYVKLVRLSSASTTGIRRDS